MSNLIALARANDAKLRGITPVTDPRTPRGFRAISLDTGAHDDIQGAIRAREMRALGFGQRQSVCG